MFLKLCFIIIILISLANQLIAQSISMNISWIDSVEVDSSKINAANKLLNDKITSHFTNYLKETDDDFLQCLHNDKIEINYLISELHFDAILIKISTDSLLFRKINFPTASYQDAKGLFLCEAIKLHLSTYVWSYPKLLITRDVEGYFYVKYNMPKGKEIYFKYYDLRPNEYTPKLSLISANYNIQDKTLGKKSKKNVKQKYTRANFVESIHDFYKYEDRFLDYILANTKIISFGP